MTLVKALTTRSLFLAIALASASAVSAAEPQDASGSRVQVTWTNPADFSELKESYGTGLGRDSPDVWLGQLSKHLRYRAERVLPPGEKLQVTFTNMQLAGTYEPWRGPRWYDVRVIKAIYPPRIDLTFTVTDASGGVVREGTRQLRDPSFLQRGILDETDPLRFEKRMLDDWLRAEFANASQARG
jgi:Protein of unknown function (DUF3016)